MRIRLFFIFG